MTDCREVSPEEPPALSRSFAAGLRRGARAVLVLAKVMIPVYVAVDLLRQSSALEPLSALLAPAMGAFGLPGEAAVVVVAGVFVNLYAAIGALAPLGLGPREVTILGLMLGLSHGMILETAIVRQLGTRWAALAGIRLGLSVVAGLLVNGLLP